jgi:hypothetical protein
MRAYSPKASLATTAIAAALAAGAALPAHADIGDAFLFKNLVRTQTASGVSDLNGFFVNAGLDSQNPGDFDAVTLTFPDASTLAIPMTAPTTFSNGPGFATQADMDAAYPFGDYTLTATNAMTAASQSVTLHYTADGYAQNIPALSDASFAALQGLNVNSSALTIDFNAQSASPLGTSDYTFFSLSDGGPSCNFLDASATSCTIDPHALLAGHTYSYQLDFSDRIESFPDGVLTGVDFDVRTIGSFTTAVPEPATWAIMLAGFAGLGAALRMRRRARVVWPTQA